MNFSKISDIETQTHFLNDLIKSHEKSENHSAVSFHLSDMTAGILRTPKLKEKSKPLDSQLP